MAETTRLEDPNRITPNPENPRLIFREDDLQTLEESIRAQGILVPLTVFEDGRRLVLLDGERRWRCAIRLGLNRVPVIVQPKPNKLQNIMMMFAIHNTRRDWDPLPTAYKLRDLEKEFKRQQQRLPTESELAELASISRGEVRRLKNLLNLPPIYHRELMAELEKPRSKQVLTVDHVLETTKAVGQLLKKDIIEPSDEEPLRRAIVDKFKTGVIRNTVDPRKLARIARAVAREDISLVDARRAVGKLATIPAYSIDDAFAATVQQADFEHVTAQLVDRVIERLNQQVHDGLSPTDSLAARLKTLARLIDRVVRG